MEHLGLVGLPDSGHAQLFSALTGLDTTDAAELPRIRAALSARQAAAEAPPRGGGGARTSDRVAGDAGR